MRDPSPQLLPQPTFLVGSMRSGTTLTRLMLDHHPEIAFEHEFDVAVERVGDDGAFPDVRRYLAWLQTRRGIRYPIDPSLDYATLVDGFLRVKQRESGGKPLVGATVHHHFDRLVHIWPDARFIHLVRDPRDVAQSIVDKGWSGNVFGGAEQWLATEALWEDFAADLPETRRIEVRYEDLVTHPESELTRLCSFLGVDYDAAMLRYSENHIQYPAPDPALAHRWRRKQAAHDTALVEAVTRPLLASRGYLESGLPALSVGEARTAWLHFHARMRRFQRRLHHLGPRLFARDVASRRLGLDRMQRRVRQEINALEQRNIDRESQGLRAPSRNIAPVAPS